MTASPYEDNPLHSHGIFHVRRDAAPRVHFLSPDGRSLCIVDAPLSDWLIFLQSVGYSVAGYSESDIVPHLKRCDVINELLRAEVISIDMDVKRNASPYYWEEPLILLEPVRVVVGCAELSKEGRWDTKLCCGDCHASGEMTEYKRGVWVCCTASKLLGDYGTGKSYTFLPDHEEFGNLPPCDI